MRFKRILSSVILKKESFLICDQKAVSCLIKKYEVLRKFFLSERRAELATTFVAFCEGKISKENFRKKAEALQEPERHSKKRPQAIKNRGRLFWKSS